MTQQDMRYQIPHALNKGHRQSNGSSPTNLKNGIANGTNGHDPVTNGFGPVQTNGHSADRKERRISDFFGHSREEVTRLLIQGLEDLGYSEAADCLSHESGYQVESSAVIAFRHAILDGSWSEAEAILFGEKFEPDGGGVSIRHGDLYDHSGLELVEDASPYHLKFLLREQKYVELLKRNRRAEALMVLQSELQPLKHDIQRLNTLSGMIISEPSGDQDLEVIAESRQHLLSELSRYISPSAMIPEHRLAQLFDQVHQSQISRCLYHNPSVSRSQSLFMDHMCDQNDFPLRTSLELSLPDGEVWFVEFSHNGKMLAACGESRAVFIYDTRNFEVRHKLLEHTNHVVYVAWSPDDTKLITCCQDAKARIWDTTTGRHLQTIDHHDQAVTTAAWTPDGKSVVTGSLDKHLQLCMRTVDNKDKFTWPTELRSQDCAITPDGRKLVVMSTENYITVYNMLTRTEDYAIKVAHRMTCISVSRDSKSMLVNMANDEIHLIDIETANVVRRFFGQQQNGFIIRSAFGGADEGLVISGSSDSKVYIWHKHNGTLIETLSGHSYGCVNAVSWNPADPTMFASGGDDRKIRIWTKDPEPSTFLRQRVSSPATHRHTL